MKFSYILIGLLVFLLCAGIAIAADTPDSITLTSSKTWAVANGVDTVVLTAHVTNTTGGISHNLDNVQVEFSPIDSIWGSIGPQTKTTDLNGNATTTFTTKTLSGDVAITATVQSNDIHTSATLHIDHDTPYDFVFFDYPNEVSVGNITTITAKFKDSHGNPIDNRNIAEKTNFSIISFEDPTLMWNTSLSSYTDNESSIPVGSNGMVQLKILFGDGTGDTYLRIMPPAPIKEQTLKIRRVADGVPYYMSVAIDPASSFVPADGKSQFVVTYTLSDQYGNVLNNRQVVLVSETGPEWGPYITTTYQGQAGEKYGPFPNDSYEYGGEIFSTRSHCNSGRQRKSDENYLGRILRSEPCISRLCNKSDKSPKS